MRKNLLRKLVIVETVAAACGWLYAKKTKAAPQLGFGQPARVTYIPREWGEYKGGSQQSGLAFQDSAGTLRFFTNIPCGGTPQVALEIRRSKRDELRTQAIGGESNFGDPPTPWCFS